MPPKPFLPSVIFCPGDAELHILPGYHFIYFAIVIFHIHHACLAGVCKDMGKAIHHKHMFIQVKNSRIVKVTSEIALRLARLVPPSLVIPTKFVTKLSWFINEFTGTAIILPSVDVVIVVPL